MADSTPPPKFVQHQPVRHRRRTSETGVILEPGRLRAGSWGYRVLLSGSTRLVAEEDLEPINAAATDPREAFLDGQFGDRASVLTYLTYLRLHEALSNYVYAFQGSRTKFYTHQFKPLLRFLDGPGRILIADEVGLGKTIEAGLVLLELKARRLLTRALVVCPASLREKWRRELLQRFDLDFKILNVDGAIAELRAAKENPGAPVFGIVSYDTVRTARVQDVLEPFSPELDIIIADEAHRLRNADTATYQAGRRLADLARHVLLLTATPINNDSRDLFNQLALLDADLFRSEAFFAQLRLANENVVALENLLRRVPGPKPDEIHKALDVVAMQIHGDLFSENHDFVRLRNHIAQGGISTRAGLVEAQRFANRLNFLSSHMIRTRRSEIDEKRPTRSTHVLRVKMNPAEEAMYRDVYTLARRYYSDFKFPVISMERIMASCIPAFFERYVGPQSVDVVPEDGGNGEDPFETDDRPRRESAIPGLDVLLANHAPAIRAAGADSKSARLLELLEELERDEPGRKAIVFSYFRGTLAYLEEALNRARIGHVVIHGGVETAPNDPEKDERERRRRKFQHDPTVRVMLSSEVGSEGLDFQFAHIVINYDLPWNPMVVEQRIGRIDRIGQKSPRLLIYSLVLGDTVDDRIYDRLLSKIRIFESSIGDIESILGSTIDELKDAIFSAKLKPEDIEKQIERAAAVLAVRMGHVQELEEGAARIVGTDHYLREEIDRIKTGRRWVGAGELEVFVHELFRRPELMVDIETSDDARVFSARVTTKLRELVRRFSDGSLPVNLFLGRLSRPTMAWTFDTDLAVDRPDLELFSLSHPLVRALVTFLSEGASQALAPNFRVEVAAIPPGGNKDGALEGDRAYALGLALAEFSVAGTNIARRELFVVPYDLEKNTVVDRTLGDRLLAAVLARAEDVATDADFTRERAEETALAIEDAAVDWTEARRAEIAGEEEAYLARRREQVRVDVRRALEAQEQRRQKLAVQVASATDAIQRQRLSNLLKGIQTQSDGIVQRGRDREAELPERADVLASTTLRGFGLVTVRG